MYNKTYFEMSFSNTVLLPPAGPEIPFYIYLVAVGGDFTVNLVASYSLIGLGLTLASTIGMISLLF